MAPPNLEPSEIASTHLADASAPAPPIAACPYTTKQTPPRDPQENKPTNRSDPPRRRRPTAPRTSSNTPDDTAPAMQSPPPEPHPKCAAHPQPKSFAPAHSARATQLDTLS